MLLFSCSVILSVSTKALVGVVHILCMVSWLVQFARSTTAQSGWVAVPSAIPENKFFEPAHSSRQDEVLSSTSDSAFL